MPIERRFITSEAEWLSWRKRYVTASNVGALFSCHPYVSALYLYMDKAGVPLPSPTGPVLRRGRILESSVAASVAEDHPEWRLEKCNEFFFDDEVRIGGTPDYFIHGDPRGLGVLQCKTVAPVVFKRDWTETDPPFWITLQALTECLLTGAAFGAVAGLVVDPFDLQCPIYAVPRHAPSESRIIAAVKTFWDDLANAREPGPDYGRDHDIMALLTPKETPDATIDLRNDNEVVSGLIDRAELKARIKRDEAECDAIETMVMSRMRDAAVATVGDFRATWKTESRKEYTVKARESRVLRIYDKRPDRESAA